ncbi:MAG: hypothetical protein JSR93_04425, partial [Verrucomicrobia bacterium]|nr:hypothetical protein [Verrucomicrobiota bacterium]
PASSSNQTTTPLVLLMGAGPPQPNFDDQIDFITREVNRMRPTSASSNASPYAQYNDQKLKDILVEFNTHLDNLNSFEERNGSTQKSQETKQKIELEIADINSVLLA